MAAHYQFYYRQWRLALLLYAAAVATTSTTTSASFAIHKSCTASQRFATLSHHYPNTNASCRSSAQVIIRSRKKRTETTTLQLSSLPSIITNISGKISPPIRNSIMIGSAAALLYKNRSKFYPPNLPIPDSAFSEPLPDGSLGCPYIGNISLFTRMGNAKSGSGEFYRYQASQADGGGNPQVFKYAPLGTPSVVITGISNMKKVFNQEFKLINAGVLSEKMVGFLGGESLVFVTDQERHQFLRRLVGQSMTSQKIDNAMPALMESATRMIDTLKEGEDVEMERLLTSFTLDVAWRQILGLNLKDDEIEKFNKSVNDWIIGCFNPLWLFLPGKRFSKSGRAFKYLVSKIEDRLDELERIGPDESTRSGMYFAKDEEDPSKRLSKADIISNSLLLIFAGSETAASTLTVAVLALGLHKDVLKKLKDEQYAMMSKHNEGNVMTREMLEKDCPYLDIVVKEVMRIKPLAITGENRFAQETFVVDGKQVPKGYGVTFCPGVTHWLDPSVREDDGSHMDIVKGFKPERWLDDKTKPTDYIPFGIGPRYCLGVNLALAEMKVFLALFVRRVEFDLTNTTPDNVEWKNFSIIPKPRDGAVITVSKLNDSSSLPVRSAVSV